MTNPYANSKNHQLWRRAVSMTEAHAINPAVNPKFQITDSDRVATAGSCFAQHISRHLAKIGFNYHVPETDPNLDRDELARRQYGVFSARYGNIYTVHQLNQLFQEAVDGKSRHEPPWEKDGAFFDPWRPGVFPEGFAGIDELKAERARHLEFVREVFGRADVFVFTLGLTEGWRSKADGAVFPLAPGVAAGKFDPSRHEFHNFNIDEVRAELHAFIEALRGFNPDVRVLLTVSPVPLIATFEDRHVLVSTTWSKSVLRVAAQEACDAWPFVDYFPSFEIITGSPTGGLYFENDRREVNSLGVAHAMRCFLDAYTDRGTPAAETGVSAGDREDFDRMSEIICDEEEIEKSIRMT